jgi:hypothetical protein
MIIIDSRKDWFFFDLLNYWFLSHVWCALVPRCMHSCIYRGEEYYNKNNNLTGSPIGWTILWKIFRMLIFVGKNIFACTFWHSMFARKCFLKNFFCVPCKGENFQPPTRLLTRHSFILLHMPHKLFIFPQKTYAKIWNVRIYVHFLDSLNFNFMQFS